MEISSREEVQSARVELNAAVAEATSIHSLEWGQWGPKCFQNPDNR